MIEVKGLHKTYQKIPVLVDLELSISEPGVFTILGPNGSGKTTLIKCMLGMVLPTKGIIKVLGNNTSDNWNYRKEINYLPQIANFPANLTVEELINMIKDLRGNSGNEQRYIEAFKLEPFLTKKLGTLSGGTKQKVNILLSFMFDSPLIILDEPTSGLDPVSLLRLKEIIREEKKRGKTILITSHVISFVEEVSDEIIFLLEGKIYFKGTVDLLKESTKQNNLEHAIANILEQHNA